MDESTKAGRREAAWMHYFAVGCLTLAAVCAVGCIAAIFLGQLDVALLLVLLVVAFVAGGYVLDIASAAQYNIWMEDDPMG